MNRRELLKGMAGLVLAMNIPINTLNANELTIKTSGNAFLTINEITRDALATLHKNLVMDGFTREPICFSNEFKQVGAKVKIRRPKDYLNG